MGSVHMSVPQPEHASSQSSSGFEDGLGRRVLEFDRETGGMLERLVLRPELSVFEAALTERIAVVAALEDERFPRPRGVERQGDRISVISDYVAGRRLSDIIECAGEHGIIAGLDAGLGLLLEILPALSRLHDAGLSHGALAPGRIMFTAAGQIALLDAIYAETLQRLQLTRKRLWAQLGLAFPPTAGPARFDKAADLAHASMVAATLSVGRALQEKDYPEGIPLLRQEIHEIASIRGSKSFADGVDKFFAATLPLAGRRTTPSADEAAIDLRKLVRKELGIDTCRTALLEFIQQVESADAERSASEAAERDRRIAAAADAVRREADRKQWIDAEPAAASGRRGSAARAEAERAERERAERERERAEQARLEAERVEAERRERERLEAERREQERVARERAEAECREREQLEAERIEKERIEKARIEAEKRERERLEAERRERERLEAERREQERIERERQEAERRERERLEAERREQERIEAERREKERIEQARIEAERRERERLEAERRERERLEAERLERERIERERLEAERRERERLEAEQRERERLEAERRERERIEQARLEAERIERERIEAERRERERLEAERRERERLERERIEAERLERERLEAERREQERLERERAEAERRERERLEQERLEQERVARERAERERAERERAEKERAEQERAERERAEKERAAKERAERERAEKERADRERAKKERADRERAERERRQAEEAVAASASTPPPSKSGWLIPPNRAASFEPVPEAEPQPAATKAYPIYVAPPEPAASWTPSALPEAKSQEEFLASLSAIRPPAAAPAVTAPSGGSPIRLKDVDRPAPVRVEARREPVEDHVSAADAYRPLATPEEKRQIPWKLIAAGVVLIGGAFAVSRGYAPSAAPMVDTVRRVIPKVSTTTPELPPVGANVGRLVITTQPAGAKVTLDGKPAGETPLTIDQVKPGRHVIAIAGAEGSARKTVKVEAGQVMTLDFPLYSGFVAISIPFVVNVSEGGKALGTSENQIILGPGRHTLRLANKELDYTATETVEIVSGEVSRLDLDPKGHANINAAPWAEVWIDGEKVGETPLANVEIRLGVREIVFKNPQFPERKQTVTITAGTPATLSVDFLK
jgi:hypothetical protein